MDNHCYIGIMYLPPIYVDPCVRDTESMAHFILGHVLLLFNLHVHGDMEATDLLSDGHSFAWNCG